MDNSFLDGAQKERIRAHLAQWLDRQVRSAMAPLFAARAAVEADPTLRGILHRLEEQGGVVADSLSVPPAQRARLKALGVRIGRHAVLMPSLLRPHAMHLRAILLAARAGRKLPDLPPAGAVSIPADGPHDAILAQLGWIAAGPVRLRLDIAEKLSGELRWRARNGPVPLPDGLPSRLGVRPEMVAAILKALEIPVRAARPLGASEYGPAAPAMLAVTQDARRRQRHRAPNPPTEGPARPSKPKGQASGTIRPIPAVRAPRPIPDGPFAALAALKYPRR